MPGNQVVDVLSGDPGVHERRRRDERVAAGRIELSASGYMVFVAVEEKTAPAMMHDQVRRIALDAVAGANLDDAPVGGGYQRKEIEQDPVFAVLRVAAKLDVGERRQIHPPPGKVPIVQPEQDLCGLSVGARVGDRRHVVEGRDRTIRLDRLVEPDEWCAS